MKHGMNDFLPGKKARTAANRPGRRTTNSTHGKPLPRCVGLQRLKPRSITAVTPAVLPVESIDGKGNNPTHPAWGSDGQKLLRLSPSAHTDGAPASSGIDRPGAARPGLSPTATVLAGLGAAMPGGTTMAPGTTNTGARKR